MFFPQSLVIDHWSSDTGHQAAAPVASLATPTADSFDKLLVDFPAVVNSSKVLPQWPSGDLEHHITTKGQQSCRYHRLDGEKVVARK